MLGELGASQWLAWADAYRRCPWGPESWDARIGYVLATLVSAITGRDAKAEDYRPRWGEQTGPSTDTLRGMFNARMRHADDRQNQG